MNSEKILKRARELISGSHQIEAIDAELEFLKKQDGNSRSPFVMRFPSGVEISPKAAKAVRALLRDDYKASREKLVKRLAELGVKARKTH